MVNPFIRKILIDEFYCIWQIANWFRIILTMPIKSCLKLKFFWIQIKIEKENFLFCLTKIDKKP